MFLLISIEFTFSDDFLSFTILELSIKRFKIITKYVTKDMWVLPCEEIKTVVHYLCIYVNSYAIALSW